MNRNSSDESHHKELKEHIEARKDMLGDVKHPAHEGNNQVMRMHLPSFVAFVSLW